MFGCSCAQSNQGVIWGPNMSDLTSPRRSYVGQSNQNESAMPNGTLYTYAYKQYNNISESTDNSREYFVLLFFHMSLAVGSIYIAVASCPHHGPSRSAPSSWYASLWAVGWLPRPPPRHRIARLVGLSVHKLFLCTAQVLLQWSLCSRWQSLPWTNGYSGP